jgi:hypothetical protein
VGDSDVVTPFGVSKYPFLGPPSTLAKNSPGSVGETTEDDLVEDLFSLGKIVIGAIGIVVVFLLSSASEKDSNIGTSTDDRVKLGIKSNLDSPRFQIFLPFVVKFGRLGKDDHGRQVAA